MVIFFAFLSLFLLSKKRKLNICNGWHRRKNVLFFCSCNMLSICPVNSAGTGVMVKGNNRAHGAVCKTLVFIYGVTIECLSSDTCS